MPAPEHDSLLAFTRGDKREADELRTALQQLRAHSGNQEFRRLADQVLSGRATLRELVRSGAFDQVVRPNVERAMAQWRDMSDEEREALAERGRRSRSPSE